MQGTNIFGFRSVLLAALSVGAFLGGCNSAQKDELAMLKEANAQLTMERDDARNALEQSEQERRRLDQEVATLQSKANEVPPAANAQAAPTTPNLDLPEGVTANVQNGVLTLTIEGDVLFDSGKASLKPDAKKTLDKVTSEIKKKYPEKRLRLAGFTDTDPIKKSNYKSNYHLGFDRAYEVREFLISKGVDGKTISLSSYGPDRPEKTKAQSRRVELLVVE